MDHYTPPPNLPAGEPSTVEVAPRVAHNPDLIDKPPVPSALPQYNPRQGRGFFFIEKPYGQWRAVIKNSSGRVTAWRDFGYTAEDYLRAWEWGSEWVGS